MESIRLKLLKVALRNGDYGSVLRYFNELERPMAVDIVYIIFKIACQTGLICTYRSFFSSLVATPTDKAIFLKCFALICRFVQAKSEYLFLPQLVGYHVALICSSDWLNEDNDTYLEDCMLRQAILKMFDVYPVVVQGWALNIATYMLSNVQTGGDIQCVIHYYRNCRNFLQVCDLLKFWKLIDLVFEHDESLVELAEYVSLLRDLVKGHEAFSSITRAVIISIGMILVAKLQNQVVTENTSDPLAGKSVRYEITYSNLCNKYPIYGDYFDRKISSMQCSMMFNINALHAMHLANCTTNEKFLLRAFMSKPMVLPLPTIVLDKVPPYLNRFFLDAPWVGEITPTSVPFLYAVTKPATLLIAGPYTVSQTRVLNAWQLFFRLLESQEFFSIEICPIMNMLYYIKIANVTIPSLIHGIAITLNATPASADVLLFSSIFYIGCYILCVPCVVDEYNVLFDAQGNFSFFTGALRYGLKMFVDRPWCRRGVNLEVLRSIKKYFTENKELLDLEYNILHFKSNTWLSRLQSIIDEESKEIAE